LFHRVRLELKGPAPAGLSLLPTDERLAKVQQGGEDPGLVAQYFRFGRYLLISSSRPRAAGGAPALPANLQGLWNDSLQPP
jgi:alpha-L-fucosidase 2